MPESAIIRKQKFKVKTSDPGLALNLRKKIQDQLDSDIIPALEKAFKGVIPMEAVLEINKISINLGKISYKNFEKHFSELLAFKLEKELSRIMKKHYDLNQLPEKANYFDNDKAEIKKHNQKDYHFKALLHYLDEGVFPWAYEKMLAKKAPSEILLNTTGAEFKSITAQALEDSNSFFRLIEICPEERLKDFLEIVLSLIENRDVREIIRFFLLNLNVVVQRLQVENKQVYQVLLKFAYTYDRKSIGGSQLLERLVLLFKKLSSTSGTITNEKVYELLYYLIKNEYEDDGAGKIHLSKGVYRTIKDFIADHQEMDISQEPLAEELAERKKEKGIKFPDKGIYINNAGIIILHPFLEALFKELQLINEKHEFVSDDKRYKAAVVLNYLFEGKDDYKEWEMAFNKILCNIPVDSVLPHDILLSAAEKEECSVLLNTVVSYWEALKNTSAEAMQETFFKREGKISVGEKSWLLQIEHKTVDILVQKIPWGVGVVKFTWLDKPIFVEW